MSDKTETKLSAILEDIYEKIEFLSNTQLIIVEWIAKQDSNFQMQFIAQSLANDDIRDGFTEFLDEFGAPDKLKTFMMEINEIAMQATKEEDTSYLFDLAERKNKLIREFNSISIEEEE